MKKTFLTILGVWVLTTASYPILAYTTYSQELQDAYTWAHSKSITTMPSVDQANMDWEITRVAMAKMIANYAE